MKQTVSKVREEQNEDVRFVRSSRKPAGRNFTSVGYWALTVWPENASKYQTYTIGFATEQRTFPWQVFVVDPDSGKIVLIKNRSTGKLIPVKEWQELEEKTSLYTLEDALAGRWENYDDQIE